MSRLRAILTVLLLLAVAAGCANIPEQSNPQVAGTQDTSEPENTVVPIDRDADPLTIARDFVAHATNVDVAKQYLTPEAQKTWEPEAQPTIMENTYNTIPPPVQEPNNKGNEQTVLIHGTKVGRLGPDNSFIPAPGAYEDKVTVQRQADGQWRVSKPPATTAITLDEFRSAYRQVPLYFFDSELNILVPDLRYVAQRPSQGLPSRVLQELLAGPSDMLAGPLRSLLGDAANPSASGVAGEDGDLVVSLTGLGNANLDTRNKIAAQIVLSLQGVATGGVIKLLADNTPLVPGKPKWRASDVPSYTAPTTPSPDLPGMFVSNGRVRSLKDGNPIPGPAGAGQYNVQSAAQSINGAQLAVVEKYGNKMRLRVGKVDGPLSIVPLTANTMTRPTWRPGANELWTVINGTTVVRLVRTKDGTWAPGSMNSSTLASFGPITTMRLSRDGTRLAMVAGGRLAVAGVDRNGDTVSVRLPRRLMEDQLQDVVDVDWMGPFTLAVAADEGRDSVLSVPFDGSQEVPYDISNLTLPVRSIAAAPNSPLTVTDKESRVWTSSVPGEAWRSQGVSGFSDPLPFYPG
ncbi:LpqB family beta-propeller domain-containing protein [Labedaea rhizosphaerae]|uniref:Sporulation and spore germination protein n=1 Tax=Labedaea rhizosphaerae TaxID=598644 RepID=A0A4R6S2D9_LABRH|nr:LpqB family beta-propeller domain-containing protein [Labedaea rhizosphaerae]TDP93730.1 sporulation and spore germination protein [Labedaea rhizosphaerae]